MVLIAKGQLYRKRGKNVPGFMKMTGNYLIFNGINASDFGYGKHCEMALYEKISGYYLPGNCL